MFEKPNFGNTPEEIPASAETEKSPIEIAKEKLEALMSQVFVDDEATRQVVFENLPKVDQEKCGDPTKLDQESIAKYRAGVVESAMIEPRTGGPDEVAEIFAKNKVFGKGSREEQMDFIAGFTDFRRGSKLVGGLRSKIEEKNKLQLPGTKKEEVEFSSADNMAARGIFLRALLDSSVADFNLESDFVLIKDFEKASEKKVAEDYVEVVRDQMKRLVTSKNQGFNLNYALGRLGWETRFGDNIHFVVDGEGGSKKAI